MKNDCLIINKIRLSIIILLRILEYHIQKMLSTIIRQNIYTNKIGHIENGLFLLQEEVLPDVAVIREY